MTSSLVGSEMCIRDRVQGQQSWVRIVKARWLARGLKDMQAYTYHTNKHTCLLYTSDAADDM
eukprot:7056991-Prorocentrum_lima.AAC.1